MDQRVLEAVEEGPVEFVDLTEDVDAPVGELFLACRSLASEGCLEATGPLSFRLTDEGRDRIERDPDPEAAVGGGPPDGDRREGGGEETDDAADGDEESQPDRGFRAFDFERAYREAVDAGDDR